MSQTVNWTYDSENGPEEWAKLYALETSGRKQSPIDLSQENSEVVQNEEEVKNLEISAPYEMIDLQLGNVGMSWKVVIPDLYAELSTLTGGPLKHRYQLEQFHCHWGKDCSCGSEHTVDGKSYAAELHFVYWNADLFKSFNEAMKEPNGLAVVAVFLDATDEPNEELSKLTSLMSNISFKGQTATLETGLSLKALMPQNLSYWTYEGSLTTPPLYESVNWIVLKTPLPCSEEQIEAFRQLHCHCEEDTPETGGIKLVQNFRPIQQLNERVVNFVEFRK